MNVNISDMIGKTVKSVVFGGDSDNLLSVNCETYKTIIDSEIQRSYRTIDESITYRFYHSQDCCESVYLESVDGDILRLLNQVIIEAYESTNHSSDTDNHESVTWTFYTIRTNLDSVTLRFIGSSNGYYSESVDIDRI